jgi:tetratricopeptide (TPR) repeat protein
MVNRIASKSNTTYSDSSGASHAKLRLGLHGFHESVAQLRQRVLEAVEQQDFNRAIALLNRLIISYPARAEDYSNRGLVHWWSGQFHKALQDFNRAIALDPFLSSAYNNRGNCHAAQGAYHKALADYEQAIDLDPFYVRARINQAITLRDLGRYDEALASLEESLLFRQFFGEIYAERGRTYHLRGDWNCAIADYHRALELFPARPQTPRKEAVQVRSRRQQILLWLQQLQPAT